jgi:hypothetical protein
MSATGGLIESNPTLTIQIDEDHSNMVKFGLGDHRIDIMATKLREIYDYFPVYSQNRQSIIPEGNPGLPENAPGELEPRGPDRIYWNNDSMFGHKFNIL